MIGIKYGFYYLFIFLTASFIGFSCVKNFKLKDMYWFQRFLLGIVFFGFLRQSVKMGRPELFMSLGYGKFDDFYFGTNPPLYYLTGYEGTTRRQGIFSGPNNYAYFLTAFFPLILLRRGSGIKKIKKVFQNPIGNLDILYVVLRVLAIAMTLSRSAIIGVALIIILLAKDRIKKNKKIAIGIFGVFILGLIGISFLKKESTINHVNAKVSYIKEIIDNPLGYGLGSSGPAIHHNGSMLPENYFMQLMLDIGTVGFIFWCIVILQMLLVFKRIKNIKPDPKEKTKPGEISNELVYLHRNRFYIGRSVLLVIGLFLHVFEDSMVNYLFFISFGILSGYLSKFTKQENKSLKNLL
ncbi:MAG TPA: O-antigen ligase family protein, partial [Candidatus Absconditabacterales bacterium]|nr:O-antigen ligase family protein [Candidatus Absconditabacterales bacterium]